MTRYNEFMKQYDVVIIGAGPAGLTAALYLGRAKMNVLIVEEKSNGGKLINIHRIENYPGISSIDGFELASNLLEQVTNLGIEILNAKVTSIKQNEVTLQTNETIDTKAIIIATGQKERQLDLPYAKEFTGKGISYCATCDGMFFKNKEVVVIGNNNKALEESLYLADIVSTLTIINRNDHFEGDKILIEKIKAKENINIHYNSIPTKLIKDNEKLEGIEINNQEIIACKGIFPYISLNPSLDFLDKNLLDEKGYVAVKEDMSTKINGIYAAGDCINRPLKQIVTACANGAIAASSIIKKLK